MVDPGVKQQSSIEPSQIRQTRINQKVRGIFLCGFVLLCVAMTCFVFDCMILCLLQGDFPWFPQFLISIVCAGISLPIFLVGLIWGGSYHLRNAACLFGAILILWAQWAIIPRIAISVSRRQAAETKHTIMQLVSEIESIRSQIGRLPENEAELAKLRGHSITISGWKTPLEYIKDPNGEAYILRAHSSDFVQVLGYNSQNPGAGVVRY